MSLLFQGEELELRNLTREMAGTYICYADNGVSQNPVWQSININILCKYLENKQFLS